MKKNRALTVILLIILLVLVAVLVFILSNRSESEPEQTPEPVASQSPMPTEAPISTPEPTAIIETPEPTPEPEEPHELLKSGVIRSDTQTKLNLEAEWSVEAKNEEELSLTVTLKLSHFSIEIGQRGGFISAGEQRKSFLSEGFENLESADTPTRTELYKASFVIPCAEGESVDIPISAVWSYNGVYSGKELKDIEAIDTVSISR